MDGPKDCTVVGGPSRDRLLPVIEQRWSPREYDATHTLSTEDIAVLLEAARWAPSAGNSQPWAFHTAPRDTPEHAALVACLAGSSRAWAPDASLIIVNLCHTHVEGAEWEFSEFAHYDLGQAVAHLSLQAQHQGLACRQFAAFDRAAVAELLGVPPHWEVVTMTAVGRPAPETRDPRRGTRKSSLRWPPPTGPAA